MSAEHRLNMLNPIPTVGLFVTPDSVNDLILTIEKIPNVNERQIAFLYAMQMMNACHKAVKDEINFKEALDSGRLQITV